MAESKNKGAPKRSVTHRGKYLAQWGRTFKNTERAIKRHIEVHPSDKQAPAHLTALYVKKVALVSAKVS